MNKEVKFNLDEDILFQIAMMTYSECNSEIATIYDHLGEEYGYSDLQDAKEYELKYEKDLLEKAVKQLQEENQELNKRMDEVLKKIDKDLAHLDFPFDLDDFEYWRKMEENDKN